MPLSKGALVTGSSKAWLGGFGEIAPFGLVSDGKKLVAKAITDKGVGTSATDTFATMANNIGQIRSISARQSRILSNVKFSINQVANLATMELISGPDRVYYHTTAQPFHTQASDGDDLYVGYGVSLNRVGSLEISYIPNYDSATDTFAFTKNYGASETIVDHKVEKVDGSYYFTLTINLKKYPSDAWGKMFWWDSSHTDQSTKTLVAKLNGGANYGTSKEYITLPFSD